MLVDFNRTVVSFIPDRSTNYFIRNMQEEDWIM